MQRLSILFNDKVLKIDGRLRFWLVFAQVIRNLQLTSGSIDLNATPSWIYVDGPNDRFQGTLASLILHMLERCGPPHGCLCEHIRCLSEERVHLEECSLDRGLLRMEQDRWVASIGDYGEGAQSETD
jgi:hypothetical protein